MDTYFLYLTDESIVVAYLEKNDAEMFLGEVECDLQDLTDLMTFSQAAIDAVLIQLSIKASNICKKRNNKDSN